MKMLKKVVGKVVEIREDSAFKPLKFYEKNVWLIRIELILEHSVDFWWFFESKL